MRLFRIIYPGRAKESFIREGIEKYIKFLRPYAVVELVELRPGSGTKEEVIEKESEELLKRVRDPFYLLDRDGREFDSEGLADFLREIPRADFVIGGVYGVNHKVKEMASMRISLSRLTFTHELSRLIFLEQIYRAMTIINRKAYHY